MTPNTVPAILDAILDPLSSIQEQVQAALELAQRNRLPPAFIQTIQASVTRLDDAWDELNEIATALDPDRGKTQL